MLDLFCQRLNALSADGLRGGGGPRKLPFLPTGLVLQSVMAAPSR